MEYTGWFRFHFFGANIKVVKLWYFVAPGQVVSTGKSAKRDEYEYVLWVALKKPTK